MRAGSRRLGSTRDRLSRRATSHRLRELCPERRRRVLRQRRRRAYFRRASTTWRGTAASCCAARFRLRRGRSLARRPRHDETGLGPIRIEGFVVGDYVDRAEEARAALSPGSQGGLAIRVDLEWLRGAAARLYRAFRGARDALFRGGHQRPPYGLNNRPGALTGDRATVDDESPRPSCTQRRRSQKQDRGGESPASPARPIGTPPYAARRIGVGQCARRAASR